MLKTFTRLHLIGIIFALIGASILFQMVRIQTNVSAQEMSESIEEVYGTIVRTVYPERGNIYDRWGNLLAGNKDVYEIGIALNEVENRYAGDRSIKCFRIELRDVYDKANMDYIEGQQSYVVITDFVSAEKVNELETLYNKYAEESTKVTKKGEAVQSLNGLHWVGHLQRSYPEGSLASNIIGFYNFKDREAATGVYGVEEKYNELLAGDPVQIAIPRDPTSIEVVPDVEPGASLVLDHRPGDPGDGGTHHR
jgi:cell division protein FtsI/penicillin-binding protein 2